MDSPLSCIFMENITLSILSDIFFARGDSANAQNANINVQNTGTFPTVAIQFDRGPFGSDAGNLVLDQNGGAVDPDTTIIIDGVEYEFIVEIRGDFPDQNSVPEALEGLEVTVLTIPALGQRIFFTTDPAGTFANMDAIGNGALAIENPNTSGPFAPVCFTKGTFIECPYGDILVEELECGDLVKNADGKLVEIVWIGKRYIPLVSLMLDKKLAPVRIKKNALGENTPSSDLLVSQQHRMLIDNWIAKVMFDESQVLAAAKHLINDHSISIEYPAEGVEYYHILFGDHQIINSNGALSESFYPGKCAMDTLEKSVRDELFVIFPELKDDIGSYGPAARHSLKGFEAAALNNLWH